MREYVDFGKELKKKIRNMLEKHRATCVGVNVLRKNSKAAEEKVWKKPICSCYTNFVSFYLFFSFTDSVEKSVT